MGHLWGQAVEMSAIVSFKINHLSKLVGRDPGLQAIVRQRPVKSMKPAETRVFSCLKRAGLSGGVQ